MLYKPVPFIYLSWVLPVAPPHLHHCHPPVNWVTGCQLEGAELCLKGRECGRIRGCVGVEDIFIVFFPTIWQGCVFSVMPLRIISSKYVKWGREIENTYKSGKDFGKYLSLLLALTSLTYITLFYLFINSNIHHMCLHHFSANDKSHTTLFTLTTMSLSSYSCAKCPGCLLPTYPTIYFK